MKSSFETEKVDSVAELKDCKLLQLHETNSANNITQFCEFMRNLPAKWLSFEYEKLKSCAPRRSMHGKKHFVPSHEGKHTRGRASSRNEEVLAMALFNNFHQVGEVAHAEMNSLRFLDYQFPLKAQQGDAGVGKVDLFGVMDNEHPCVVELKITHQSGSPLCALLEALSYCAMVEANIEDIAKEAQDKHGVHFRAQQPRFMLLAPDCYWDTWINHPEAGNWQPEFLKLIDELHAHIGLRGYLGALCGVNFPLTYENSKPLLKKPCIVKPVFFDKKQ